MSTNALTLTALPNFPDVQPGDDLGALITAALTTAGLSLREGDILCVAQKIVSKAENRYMRLSEVTPSARALQLADEVRKDPRLVELILQESTAVSRTRPGVIITRHRLGFIAANAGIDRSNVVQDDPEHERVLLLPLDPDASARRISEALYESSGVNTAVVITDSHGRPFRIGTVGVAIGSTGLPAVWDKRGAQDRYGYRLRVTEIGLADEVASAASLLMGQGNEGQPIILMRGLDYPFIPESTTAKLIRPAEFDLYV
jgi:coenzyme F420-0:L-glutamate ligase/coenzyme F420-1:gamma-L-glutamate ligase